MGGQVRQAQAVALSKAHEASVQMEEQLAQHADKVRLPSRTRTHKGARARSSLSTVEILHCSAMSLEGELQQGTQRVAPPVDHC